MQKVTSRLLQCRTYATAVREHAKALQYMPMYEDWTDSQKSVREAITKLCQPFDDAYWRSIDKEERWPVERQPLPMA
jgi:hypothetical protein